MLPITYTLRSASLLSGLHFYHCHNCCKPQQLLMVDRNGLVHPRGKFFLLILAQHHHFLPTLLGGHFIYRGPKNASIVGFELAYHHGVLAYLPTIGIGKNLHHVAGLTESGARQSLKAQNDCTKDLVTLTGSSGKMWGAV
ncbi:hypothetical protein GIB67_009581, partial [Kingdonia uniflora]